MFGLLDTNAEDPQIAKLAEAYGLPPALVAQAQNSARSTMLGNMGATLFAAGQAGPMGQRGQLLSKMDFSSGADMNKQLLNSAQMRIYTENIKERRDAAARRQELRQQIGSLSNLTTEQRALAITDPEGVLKSIEAERRGAREAEQPFALKVKQLVASGMEDSMARGIASGRYVVKQDALDGVVVVDIATGQAIGRPGRQGVNAAPVAQSPLPTRSTADPTKTLDYSAGTGSSGALGNVANKGLEIFGMSPRFPDVESAKTALESLRMRTITEMSAAIPGRDTNQIRSYMEQRVVNPGSMLTGDHSALTKFGQVRSDINAEISRLEQLVLSGGIRATDVAAVRQNMSSLKALRRDYDVVIQNFGQSRAADTPQQQRPSAMNPATAAGASPAPARIRIDISGNLIQ